MARDPKTCSSDVRVFMFLCPLHKGEMCIGTVTVVLSIKISVWDKLFKCFWTLLIFGIPFLSFFGSLGFPELKDRVRTFFSLQRFLGANNLHNIFLHGEIPVETFLKSGSSHISQKKTPSFGAGKHNVMNGLRLRLGGGWGGGGLICFVYRFFENDPEVVERVKQVHTLWGNRFHETICPNVRNIFSAIN